MKLETPTTLTIVISLCVALFFGTAQAHDYPIDFEHNTYREFQEKSKHIPIKRQTKQEKADDLYWWCVAATLRGSKDPASYVIDVLESCRMTYHDTYEEYLADKKAREGAIK